MASETTGPDNETMIRRRLAENTLFAGMAGDILHTVCDIPELVDYADREVIFDEGHPPNYVYLIADGTVRISKQGRRRQQETLAHLGAGDFFGEMGVYDREVRCARATACHAVQLGRVDRRGLEELLLLAPIEISSNLSRGLMRRLRELDSHFIREILEAERLSLLGSMAAGIVHDLKNPLSVILGVAALLEEEQHGQPDRLAAMIRRSGSRMLEMIQDILEYARGELHLERRAVAVDRLLADLLDATLNELPNREIRVERSILTTAEVRIDHDRFMRVLQNLVSNAIDAMPGGGILSLSAEEEAGNIVIQIADTGCGIPADILPRIFEPFVTHGKSGGTGLGMAIAHAIVEAHGGTIHVDSVVGRGSRFRIVLPG